MADQHQLSKLLSPNEKSALIEWLGSGVRCLASGICQLLISDPRTRQWSKLGVGIVCMNKDYNRRIHVIQVFDSTGQLFLEQRLYKNFTIHCNHVEKFMQFEGDDAIFGLNLADVHESRVFRNSLQKRKQSTQIPSQNTSVTAKGIICQPASKNNVSKKSTKKKKLTRSDISLPKHFRHLSHFDISPQKSFVSPAARSAPKLDPMIRDLLESIGEPIEQLNDDEQVFVCDFIQQHGGVGNMKQEMHESHFYSAIPKARIARAPPPPPPPLPAADMNLDVDIGNNGAGNRSDFLAQIQQGKQLRSIGAGDTWPRNAIKGPATQTSANAIADALARALAERREHMKPTDDASDVDDATSDSDEADWDC